MHNVWFYWFCISNYSMCFSYKELTESMPRSVNITSFVCLLYVPHVFMYFPSIRSVLFIVHECGVSFCCLCYTYHGVYFDGEPKYFLLPCFMRNVCGISMLLLGWSLFLICLAFSVWIVNVLLGRQ